MTTPHLKDFLAPFAKMHITIETSGIAFVGDLPCDLMSISPKLSNSTPEDTETAKDHEENRLNFPALQQLIDTYDYQLKFVVDTPADLDEIAETLKALKNVRFDKVLLMPQAANLQEYIEKSRFLAQICEQTGFAFGPRLQLLLWDGQKGK